MSDKLKAAVLILSDLHFGADLLREAEIPPVQRSWWTGFLFRDIRRYMETRCKSHDLAILMSLPRYLRMLIQRMRREGYDRRDFDLYLILGDLSTFANGASYSFLRQYLLEAKYSTPGFPAFPAMKIPTDKLVALPGNHDKMLRKDLEIFNREFASRLGQSIQLQPQRSFFLGRTAGEVEFLFILVDAGIYTSAEGKLDLSAREHLARGEISTELRDEIKSKLSLLRQGEPVDRAALQDYGSVVKVLLVHYAVDVQTVLSRMPNLEELALPHDCRGLSELVTELRPDLNLVIHGHLHWPKVYNYQGVQVVSATSTTQKGEYNGFFVVKFFESGDVFTEHHKWKTNAFSKDDNAELNVPILNLSKVRAIASGKRSPEMQKIPKSLRAKEPS
jgi:3',5'-cyclic AMP phosphodiesterase CpdA